MSRFVLLGDVMVDVTATITAPIARGSDTAARISVQAGGSAANTARWLAWSGHPCSLLGCIGDDALGSIAVQALRDDGVQPMLAMRKRSVTGTCVVIVEATGERSMLPDAGANASLTPADLPATAFATEGHLHLSGYTLLRASTRNAGLAACRQARAAGMSISLDVSSAAPITEQPHAFDEVYPIVDLLLANEAEAIAITGARGAQQAALDLAERVPVVVVKLGAQGAIGVLDGRMVHEPALDCQVVDTTGAGDAFAAGLLPAWGDGSGLAEALSRGHALAAEAVRRVGAGPGARQGQE